MPESSSSTLSGTEPLIHYAERVLFSESMEEKLRFPLKIDFDTVPESHSTDDLYDIEPGRPSHLKFAGPDDIRPSLPSAPALVDEAGRGVLLHFFANHELLAAELMALAILRFQNAPSAFLKGLAKTLKEEQRHTRWYLSRMRDCGIEFGEYPVNRFFWDSVSTMECPLDYVSRLSLTFEQANLDYSKHYATILRKAGDHASSEILDRIYRDEISHVGYGLRWFRKWKDESDSDWSALEKRLVFPLSPIRAKGNQTPFNAKGRKAAGFDDEYIRNLGLFERSRGRTPDVYFFNPEAENEVAAAPNPYHPPAKIRAVIDDLEPLVLFLAKRDDLVLMRKPPSDTYRAQAASVGLHLPEVEPLSGDAILRPESLLQERKIHRFLPWSKAPALANSFPEFLQTESNGTGNWKWKPEDRGLFSKSAQAAVFGKWFGESHEVRNHTDLESAISAFHEQGIQQAILKRCFATAGTGMKRVSIKDLEELLAKGFRKTPEQSAGILLEPFHDRIFDFAVQFEIRSGKAKRISTVEQTINSAGGYRGTIAMPKFCQGLPPEVARFLMEKALPHYDEESELIRTLEEWAAHHQFSGPLGIDSYLHRSQNGAIQHRPICEINPRFTMGRVAHELRRRVAPGFGLKFQIIRSAEFASTHFDYTLKDGLLSGGCFPLTEGKSGSTFEALIHVAKQRKDLQGPDF